MTSSSSDTASTSRHTPFPGLQVFLEDAGFDWKILGPDVQNVDYVAWQCDQDAYACSGQKCSAQSMLFMHKNWAQAGASCQRTGLHSGHTVYGHGASFTGSHCPALDSPVCDLAFAPAATATVWAG